MVLAVFAPDLDCRHYIAWVLWAYITVNLAWVLHGDQRVFTACGHANNGVGVAKL